MPALTDAQRREFEDHGFLLLPALFSEEEIAPVPGRGRHRSGAGKVPKWWRRADSHTVRLVYGAHRYQRRVSTVSPAIRAGWSRCRS